MDIISEKKLTNEVKTEQIYNNIKLSNLEFISLNSNVLSENEFFKIINAGKKGVHKNAGKYQESLYWHYISAKKEKDSGYLNDVLKKGITLQKNIEEVEGLIRNKNFMKEWRKNMGNISPLKVLKESGKMKKIYIIKSLI